MTDHDARTDQPNPRRPRPKRPFPVHATPLVRADRLGRPSRTIPRHGRPVRALAAEAGKWGTMRLLTVGRKTGKEREAIVAYFEDGPNIVTMAMNGWGEGEPAWWLNLLHHPDAEIELKGEGRTRTHPRPPATGERTRPPLGGWRAYTPHLDAYATKRPTETAVVAGAASRLTGSRSCASSMHLANTVRFGCSSVFIGR